MPDELDQAITLINHRQRKLTRHGSKSHLHDIHEDDPQVVFEAVKQKPFYKGALPRGTVIIKPKAGYVFLMVMAPFLIIL
jgi:hypothetical protein